MKTVDLSARPNFQKLAELFSRVRNAEDLCAFMSTNGPLRENQMRQYRLDDHLAWAEEFREILEAHRCDSDDMAIESIEKLGGRPLSLQVVPKFNSVTVSTPETKCIGAPE